MEWTPNLVPPIIWQPGARIPMTNMVRTVETAGTGSFMKIYRAYEFVADPPLLSAMRTANGGFSYMFYGKLGGNYQLESLTNWNGVNPWSPQHSVMLTNSFHYFQERTPTNALEIFRIKIVP